eukprot:TRINITY_DN3460_c0_g1_i1.p1 TRINITY_DN3460_c0_g1~~TRINITY_DN3460_c0_g1_i1.p1  ORF type:complete len:414 (-),score=136.28 TRINITY_DN3460_c0_g1_i1:51-1292(-)
MDIRSPVLAILCGGSPAPGINGVISAAALEALDRGLRVIGILQGWKLLKEGQSGEDSIVRFRERDVTGIYTQGGSIIMTSKAQVSSQQEVDNVLRALEHLQVQYLITIGGTDTMYSASMVAKAARQVGFPLSVIHVPKTIFNDLPLPESAKTFGFATAREHGARIARNLHQDAKTTQRWYVVVVMGQRAGHLALTVGKCGAATITVIPEEFKESGFTWEGMLDMLEACIIKRRAQKKHYGVIVLTEGLVNLMSEEEVRTLFGGMSSGHVDLGRKVGAELRKRFSVRGIDMTFVDRYLGQELRCADPSGEDIEIARDLGYGAVKLAMEDVTGSIVTIKSGSINPIPFDEMLDPDTGYTQIRNVDMNSLGFVVARKYMIRLERTDLEDGQKLTDLAEAGNMTPAEFLQRFSAIAS